jgi:hypothetical protein
MEPSVVYSQLKQIIALAEDKISNFHRIRKDIDTLKKALMCLVSKKVHQECCEELSLAHQEIQACCDMLDAFAGKYKKYFYGSMERYLRAYIDYLHCAKLASRQRLEIQRAILHFVTMSKTAKTTGHLKTMMNEMKSTQRMCQDKAAEVNRFAGQTKAHD